MDTISIFYIIAMKLSKVTPPVKNNTQYVKLPTYHKVYPKVYKIFNR